MKAANVVEIHLRCNQTGDDHECTAKCAMYGFHDLRRAFATNNAQELPPLVLQRLMGHKSFQTTQGYIQYAEEQSDQQYNILVTDGLKRRSQRA